MKFDTSWVEYASVDGKTVSESVPLRRSADAQIVVFDDWESEAFRATRGLSSKGYFAKPKQADASTPAVIAIHEWWGLNKVTIADVLRLVGLGYQVLAPDLYYGKVTHDENESQKLMQEVIDHPNLAKDNLKQAYQYLSDRGATKIGVIGWCFGGSWSLQTALLFPKELSAAVIYYGTQVGQVGTEDLEPLSMPILGFFGADDQIIPVENVRQFKSNLEQLGKEAKIHIYEGIGHAFADPTDDRFLNGAFAPALRSSFEATASVSLQVEKGLVRI